MVGVQREGLLKMCGLLKPTTSILKKPFFNTEVAGHSHKVDDIAVNAVKEEYVAYKDGSLSTAARLQTATCPEHVAEVLQSIAPSERVYRVKLWAKLSPKQIHNLPALPHLARQCLEQVCNIMIGNVQHILILLSLHSFFFIVWQRY